MVGVWCWGVDGDGFAAIMRALMDTDIAPFDSVVPRLADGASEAGVTTITSTEPTGTK